MRNELSGRRRKAGMVPGALVYTGENNQQSQLDLSVYNATECQQTTNANLKECLTLEPTENNIIWIHVTGLSDIKLIEQLNTHFKIHPLVTEDILNTEQRAKCEEYNDYIFLTLKALSWDNDKQKFIAEQTNIIFGNGFVLTFQDHPTILFNKIQERLKHAQGRLRENKSDYLAYALVDIIVDQYFVILDNCFENIEKVETEVITDPTQASAPKLYRLKQQMYALRKVVWPSREIVNQLLRSDSKLINHSTTLYLRDVYDHTIQAIETIDSFHNRLDNMLDVYLSTLTNRMNEVMKVLTIIATLFIPLTFIASIYGMNFTYMPELHSRWGYPIVLGVMACMAISMLIFFKRKRWL